MDRLKLDRNCRKVDFPLVECPKPLGHLKNTLINVALGYAVEDQKTIHSHTVALIQDIERRYLTTSAGVQVCRTMQAMKTSNQWPSLSKHAIAEAYWQINLAHLI